ncbi:MAG: hypothetical protein E7442_01555 [Ruminococcaceae bacterium]|nr:hypothetical protein [Oscillospiraceae bacterium]
MICIKNGKLVLPGGVREDDLYIRGEKIFSIGGHWAGAEEYDARGCYVFPGFVDTGCTLGMDSQRRKTACDWAASTEAALCDGCTTVVDTAVQKAGASLLEAVDAWGQRAEGRCSADYAIRVRVTDGNRSVLREVPRLTAVGVSSFAAHMSGEGCLEEDDLGRLLSAAANTGFVTMRCGLESEIARNVRTTLASGAREALYHALSRPVRTEALAVRQALAQAREARVAAWIAPVSCEEALEEIRAARRRGQYVLAETHPAYLTLTQDIHLNREARSAGCVCAPPLRSRSDCEALWRALAAGEIQLIGSGHCGYSLAQKNAAESFDQIPEGFPALGLRASLLYSEGVARRRITVEDMARLLSENPAKCLGLYPRKGVLKAGSDADVVIWDPAWQGTVHSAADGCWSPWEGLPLTGRARAVFLRGQLTASMGTVLSFGRGQYLKREKVF